MSSATVLHVIWEQFQTKQYAEEIVIHVTYDLNTQHMYVVLVFIYAAATYCMQVYVIIAYCKYPLKH